MMIDGGARLDGDVAGGRGPMEWLRRNWGLALWCAFGVAIACLAVARPMRPITRIYLGATLDWWAGHPVYTGGIHGFLYFPSAAVLFGPFALLSTAVADQIWRLMSVGVLTWAVYRAAALVRPGVGPEAGWTGGQRGYGWREHVWRGGGIAPHVLALAIPTASINLLRGQWDLLMFAVLLHAAVDVAWGRWTRGGLLLALAVALKPLALVPALLFAALRPRTAPALLVGLAAALAAPFLVQTPDFVIDQYAAMFVKLRVAAEPDSGRWFDLTVFLGQLGWAPPYAAMTAVRVLAAGCTLLAGRQAYRRLDGRSAALVVLMLAVSYLMLFNPRTEEGSYLGVAVLASLALFAEHRRRPDGALPVLLGALVVGLGTHFYGDWIYRPTQGWLKQALTLAFYAYIAALIAAGRPLVDPPPLPARRCEWRRDRVAFVLCAALVPLYAIARLLVTAPLRAWLSAFEVTDYLALVVGLNLLGVALVVASGPLWAWMRGRNG